MQKRWDGITLYVGTDATGRYCITDDRDVLPPTMLTFREFAFLGVNLDGTAITTHEGEVSALVSAIRQTEAAGTPVMAQVGAFSYETDWTGPIDECAAVALGI